MFTYNVPFNLYGCKNGKSAVISSGNVLHKLNPCKRLWVASYLYSHESDDYTFVPVICNEFNGTQEGFELAMQTALAAELHWQSAQQVYLAECSRRNEAWACHELSTFVYGNELFDKIAGAEVNMAQDNNDLVVANCISND